MGRDDQDAKLAGSAWVLGDDVDTDLIIAGPYLTIQDEVELASHALEAVLPEFARSVAPGDAIVGGRNFGTGSSREEAVFVLKYLGVRLVVAESFARIFFRNCINLGVLALQHPEARARFSTGDAYSLDLATFTMKNQTRGSTLQFDPLPPFLMEIYAAGGALAQLKAKLTPA